MKGRLEEAGLPVPKTHDLEDLLNRLLPVEPLWAAFRPAVQRLTDHAVDSAIQAIVRPKAMLGRQCGTASLFDVK